MWSLYTGDALKSLFASLKFLMAVMMLHAIWIWYGSDLDLRHALCYHQSFYLLADSIMIDQFYGIWSIKTGLLHFNMKKTHRNLSGGVHDCILPLNRQPQYRAGIEVLLMYLDSTRWQQNINKLTHHFYNHCNANTTWASVASNLNLQANVGWLINCSWLITRVTAFISPHSFCLEEC